MKTVEAIITMFGGVEGLYVSIENAPFMRLVIEHIGGGPHGLPAISVAHYYELMAISAKTRRCALKSRTHPTASSSARICFRWPSRRCIRK